MLYKIFRHSFANCLRITSTLILAVLFVLQFRGLLAHQPLTRGKPDDEIWSAAGVCSSGPVTGPVDCSYGSTDSSCSSCSSCSVVHASHLLVSHGFSMAFPNRKAFIPDCPHQHFWMDQQSTKTADKIDWVRGASSTPPSTSFIAVTKRGKDWNKAGLLWC